MKPKTQDRSQRQLRVAEQIKQILIETLHRGHLHKEDFGGTDSALITISDVHVSPDLKNATAHASALNKAEMSPILEGLNQSSSYFQKELGRKLEIKFTPRIRFVSEEGFDKADRLEAIFRKIEDEKR